MLHSDKHLRLQITRPWITGSECQASWSLGCKDHEHQPEDSELTAHARYPGISWLQHGRFSTWSREYQTWPLWLAPAMSLYCQSTLGLLQSLFAALTTLESSASLQSNCDWCSDRKLCAGHATCSGNLKWFLPKKCWRYGPEQEPSSTFDINCMHRVVGKHVMFSTCTSSGGAAGDSRANLAMLQAQRRHLRFTNAGHWWWRYQVLKGSCWCFTMQRSSGGEYEGAMHQTRWSKIQEQFEVAWEGFVQDEAF